MNALSSVKIEPTIQLFRILKSEEIANIQNYSEKVRRDEYLKIHIISRIEPLYLLWFNQVNIEQIFLQKFLEKKSEKNL